MTDPEKQGEQKGTKNSLCWWIVAFLGVVAIASFAAALKRS